MVADFHNDYLTFNRKQEIISKYKQEDNVIIGAIFKGERDYVSAKSILNFYLKNKANNLLFAFEDFSYEEDFNNLIHGLLDYKPVYVGLTWNYENCLAHGAYSNGKIKRKGIELINEMNAREITLDVAHLCEKSFYDALNFTNDIVCSHACFYDINEHPRNLKKKQIDEIVKRNGLVGLTLYKPFLTNTNSADVEVVFRHIDYFAENFELNNLSIGTDFYGCNDFPSGFSNYDFSSVIKSCLLRNGYKEESIDGILYGNLTKFLCKRGFI